LLSSVVYTLLRRSAHCSAPMCISSDNISLFSRVAVARVSNNTRLSWDSI
jgi:hypothetical protein